MELDLNESVDLNEQVDTNELVDPNVTRTSGMELELDDGVDPLPKMRYSGHNTWLVFFGAPYPPGYNTGQSKSPVISPNSHGATRIALLLCFFFSLTVFLLDYGDSD